MDFKKELGNRLRTVRERAGLKQPTLAFRVGLEPKNKTRVSNYENGDRKAPVEYVCAVTKALEPILGKGIAYYLVTGEELSEGEKPSAGNFTHEQAVAAFKSVIGNAIDVNRIRLEPGLDENTLVSEFVLALLGDEASTAATGDALRAES